MLRFVISLKTTERVASEWEDTTHTKDRVGFKRYEGEEKKEKHYFFFPESFKVDVYEGFDLKVVTEVLIAKGWLMPDAQGRSTRAENLPGLRKSVRCYRINGEAVFADEI